MTGATSVARGLPVQSRWRGLSFLAKLYICLVVLAGLATLLHGGIHQTSKNIAEFICYLGIAILASGALTIRSRRRPREPCAGG